MQENPYGQGLNVESSRSGQGPVTRTCRDGEVVVGRADPRGASVLALHAARAAQ